MGAKMSGAAALASAVSTLTGSGPTGSSGAAIGAFTSAI